MKERLEQLEKDVKAALDGADTPEKLEETRVKYIGRKGILTEILKSIRDVSSADRPYVGEKINELKRRIEEKIEGRAGVVSRRECGETKAGIDLSLPGTKYETG